MKIRKGIVAAFWISFFLPFTAPIYFGVSDEAIKPWRALELQRSSGGLEQDQLVLAGDMRQLRRDLRHRASDGIINFEARRNSPGLARYRYGPGVKSGQSPAGAAGYSAVACWAKR